jgi:hypothetical protein
VFALRSTVIVATMSMTVFAGLAVATAVPAVADAQPPECVEVYVLPDDATLPYAVVCRP